MKDLLPEKIFRRRNMGLEMPHSIWFLNEFCSMREKYFSRKNVEKSGILNYKTVNSLWKEASGAQKGQRKSAVVHIKFPGLV